MNVNIAVLSSIALLALIGCDDSNQSITVDNDGTVCTTEVVSAINLNVFDTDTGLAGACGATVTIEDGDFSETLTNEAGDNCDDEFTLSLAAERAGTYDITIAKEGYTDWVQYDTLVTSNECHVNDLTISAYISSTALNDEDLVCTEGLEPAIEMSVYDANTGLASACGATVTIEDGDFSETFTNEAGDNCIDDLVFSLGEERAGTYNITVMKDGYNDWLQYDTVVTDGVCHVNTISVQAYIEQ